MTGSASSPESISPPSMWPDGFRARDFVAPRNDGRFVEWAKGALAPCAMGHRRTLTDAAGMRLVFPARSGLTISTIFRLVRIDDDAVLRRHVSNILEEG